MKQQDLANKTGLKQPHIGGYLKDMEDCDVLRKPIVKILKAQGKWEQFKKAWKSLLTN